MVVAMSQKALFSARQQDWERSQTFNRWVPLSCAAIGLLLPFDKIFDRSQHTEGDHRVCFWGNHPIYHVYLTGLATVLKSWSKRAEGTADDQWLWSCKLEIDDGTGPTTLVTIFGLPNLPDFDLKFVEIYGHLNQYQGIIQIIADKIIVPPPNLGREIDLQHEALRVQTELISKPINWRDLKSPQIATEEPRQILSLSRPGPLSGHSKFKRLESLSHQVDFA